MKKLPQDWVLEHLEALDSIAGRRRYAGQLDDIRNFIDQMEAGAKTHPHIERWKLKKFLSDWLGRDEDTPEFFDKRPADEV